MGNAASDVTSGVKKQAEADTTSQKLYQLVDLKGTGSLVDLAKQATTTKNYAALDEAIKSKVEPLLYNKGEGKLFHISKLVLMRNRERGKHKHIFKNEEMYDTYEEPIDDKDPTHYRMVCWDLNERGSVGETCFLICFLCATAVHLELGKRLLMFYPKLIHDVYMSDEYYGESVLHISIVNEDPQLVKFLLDNGANPNERCFGAFMSAEDQKASRTDSLDQEAPLCDPNTNYQGYVYWGEYPACFAACLGQEDCYRLILAKGADPNSQDCNGNTVLHMLVIHHKQQMFDTAYELGADLHITNRLNLTPMTLAAKLARKELFFHILNISREIYWQIGSVTCAAYPLNELDTIDPDTGGIQKESALNLIVFGETTDHLELMEGPVDDLLQTKWQTFIKAKFYRQFILFSVYFFLCLVAFVLRPVHKAIPLNNAISKSQNHIHNIANFTIHESPMENITTNDTSGLLILENSTVIKNIESCFDKVNTPEEVTRFVLEGFMLAGAIAYLLGAAKESHFLGASMFFENLATAPSRVLFLFSRILVLLMGLLRLMCWHQAEDIVAVIVMLTTAPFFLFFCRGFKTVGPFVVMIYRMITGDLLRFVIIYLVFVMGFSQAFFIVFLSYNKKDSPNPMGNPPESVITLFMMSLSSFDTTYEAFQHTDHEEIAQLLFVGYMAIVAILLINMLIAMMGNTYTKIAETKNEWQRQWARIVLVVERGVPPKERQRFQEIYSQPMGDGSRALVLRLNQTDDEKEEMKDLLDLRRYHDKSIQKRLSKLIASQQNQAPRKSIVNSLHHFHQSQSRQSSIVTN